MKYISITKRAIISILILVLLLILISGCSGEGINFGPTPTFTPRPTPWGPAGKISATSITIMPCKLSGSRCAEWQFMVTFTSENNISAKVENLRMAFVSKENVIYAEGGYPTWFGVNIPISANSSAQYQGKVTNPKDPDLQGGRMDFMYQGYDANGNKFSGKISVTLGK